VQVALDGKTKRAAEVAHADESEFRTSHPKVAEAEGDVVETELLGSKRLLPF
jgi:hypothetical protein